jgi:hypothetical protein
MESIGYKQTATDLYSGRFERRAFFQKRLRIEHDSAPDHADRGFVKDAGRDDMQNIALPIEGNRVSCIVAALIARDTIESVGEDIDDLAFSFVTPLEPDDGDILFHERAGGLPPQRVDFKSELLLLSAEVLVQRLGNDVLADGADNLFSNLTIFEEKQRGDASNIESG